jgi:hypothetical protein
VCVVGNRIVSGQGLTKLSGCNKSASDAQNKHGNNVLRWMSDMRMCARHWESYNLDGTW